MVKSIPNKLRTLTSEFNESESANMGQMMGLVGIAVVALILAVILEVGPIVGYNTASAVTIPQGNHWNSENGNTAITNGSELWSQLTPMVAVAGIVGVVGVIIVVLFSVLVTRSGNNGGGGL